MASLIPLGENIIIRPLVQESTTASGIIIPDTASKEKPIKGKVIAVGPGTSKKKTDDIKEGDVVIFSAYAPTEIKIDNEELYVVGVDSILAKQK